MSDHEEFYSAVRAAKGPTKRCSACQVDHPVEEFAIKHRDRLLVHPKCKAAQREARQSDYAENAQAHKARAAAYRARRRAETNEIVDAWLADRVCVRCEEPGRHLIAVASDGRNIRPLQRDGFTLDDIRMLLASATAECRKCRTSR